MLWSSVQGSSPSRGVGIDDLFSRVRIVLATISLGCVCIYILELVRLGIAHFDMKSDAVERQIHQRYFKLTDHECWGVSCALQKLKNFRTLLLKNLNMCMDLKINYVKFQAQAL